MAGLVDLNGAPITIPSPHPECEFTLSERNRFGKWWVETAFPKLKEELGDVVWGGIGDGWAIILLDNDSKMQVCVMRPPTTEDQKAFYLEPNDEHIDRIAAVIRATRTFNDAARGREKKPDAESPDPI